MAAKRGASCQELNFRDARLRGVHRGKRAGRKRGRQSELPQRPFDGAGLLRTTSPFSHVSLPFTPAARRLIGRLRRLRLQSRHVNDNSDSTPYKRRLSKAGVNAAALCAYLECVTRGARNPMLRGGELGK